jgi:FMN phosphatase YigB (HAD superfamily)
LTDNKKTKFVYFDLGNVLVLFDHTLAAGNLARAAGLSAQQVLEAVFKTDVQRRYETGLLSDSQYCQEINRLLDCQMPDAVILQAISDMFTPNWPIIDALEAVRSAGVPMGILSNTCDAHWQWLAAKGWPMLQYDFRHTILSYEVGSMKPDSGIYAASESACGLQGQQIYFTDDLAKNINAASQRNWATHQFRSVAELLQELIPWLETW